MSLFPSMFLQDDQDFEIYVLQCHHGIDGRIDRLGHLLYLGGGSPPVGHIDGLMDDNPLSGPCPCLHNQVFFSYLEIVY